MKTDGIMEVVMRLPLTYLVDTWFKNEFGLHVIFFSGNGTAGWPDDVDPETIVVRFVLCAAISAILVFLWLLPLKNLYSVYLYAVALCLLLLVYWINIKTLTVLLPENNYMGLDQLFKGTVLDVDIYGIIRLSSEFKICYFIFIMSFNIVVQFCSILIFKNLHIFTPYNSVRKIFCYSFSIPLFLVLVPHSKKISSTVAMLTIVYPLFIMWKTLWCNRQTIRNLICDGYHHVKNTVTNRGREYLFVTEMKRYKVSNTLQVYWAVRILEHFFRLAIDLKLQNETVYDTLKYLFIIKGCDTPLAILAMGNFISYFGYHVGSFFNWVLMTEIVDCPSIEYITRLIFVESALPLMFMEPEKRCYQFYQTCILLCYITLISVRAHNAMLLMSYTLGDTPLGRHLRALSVCIFLIVFPPILLYVWSIYSYNIWWMVIFSLYNIKLFLLVLIDICYYLIFLIDDNLTSYWKKFDDYECFLNLSVYWVSFCQSSLMFLACCFRLVFKNVEFNAISLNRLAFNALLYDYKALRDILQ